MWIAADLECMNVPSEFTSENDIHNGNKLVFSKTAAIGYSIVKNPECVN